MSSPDTLMVARAKSGMALLRDAKGGRQVARIERQAKKRMRRRCAEKISMMNQMTMPMTIAFVAIKNRHH